MVALRTTLRLGALAPLALGSGDETPELRFALRAAKAIVCGAEGERVIDDAIIVVDGGKIAALGRAGEIELDADCLLVDVESDWVMPGMIDLHAHIAGARALHGFSRDINDMVYQANPELRASCTVIPANANLEMALAVGVTTVLYIPGSGTAVSGQGVLLKTAPFDYEDALVRDPGSLKTAQGSNPTAWAIGCGPMFYNWSIRECLRRGVAYAERWAAWERSAEPGEPPELEPMFEIFRALVDRRAQASTHTQQQHVVAETLRLHVKEFGIPTFIDHGEFDGFLSAPEAERLGVPAILGPRSISSWNAGRQVDHDGKILGLAAEWQARGHSRIGFNTDSPVIPEEELAVQACIALRFGLEDASMASVRGLTIVPAEAAGIAERVGSLAVGKDADLVVIGGHPADPRSPVERVYVGGRLAYDAAEGRRF
jgi:imidazolonepropionase-like amidohydrolase